MLFMLILCKPSNVIYNMGQEFFTLQDLNIYNYVTQI